MRDHFLNCNGRLIDLQMPKIMGILNLTPDSFSDGGKYNTIHSALRHAETLIREGAEIIDIGPQSTRPGAEFLSSEEEIRRIGSIISEIKKEFPDVLVSLDTFYGATVRFGFNEGIDIVNDISAGQFDDSMWPEVAGTRLPYIVMHSNPEYSAMHQKIQYEDITLAVNRYLMEKTRALMEFGIHDIILDPGFGFGKTVDDQMKLLEEAGYLGFGRFPLLIGISRKSFIYRPLGKSPSDINEETQKLHLKVLQQGAKILRVHDVAEAKKTVDEFLSRRSKIEDDR